MDSSLPIGGAVAIGDKRFSIVSIICYVVINGSISVTDCVGAGCLISVFSAMNLDSSLSVILQVFLGNGLNVFIELFVRQF
jgi:hypothetical protein